MHVFVSRAGKLSVYTVKREGKDGPLRTLHRDLLLPCGELQLPEEPSDLPKTQKRPSTRRNPSYDIQKQPDFDVDDDVSEALVYQDPPVLKDTRIVEVYETGKNLQNTPTVPLPQIVYSDDLPGEIASLSPECLPESENLENESMPTLRDLRVDPDAVELDSSENLPVEVPETVVGQDTSVEDRERVGDNGTVEEQAENDNNFIRRLDTNHECSLTLNWVILWSLSLFQSLSTAVTDSIIENGISSSPDPIITQPVKCMHRDVHRVSGGGCNPGV